MFFFRSLSRSLISFALACPWVVPFVACGRHADFNFLVMELLGENIAELRRLQQGRFSMTTTLKLGIQMIKGIESVHDFGYLHRDIKPSNFAMGLIPSKKETCFLIDFGLARRYMLPDGEIRPPRDAAGFRGTARYASINSHQSRDLGRRDDLWSVLYLLIEFAQGQLPWRRLRDKDKVGEMKLKCNNDDLVAGLPPEFLQFMKHLMSLHYHSRPDYTYLISMFDDLYKRLGGNDKTPFDWDLPQVPNVRRSRPLPSLLDYCFVRVVSDVNRVIHNAEDQVLAKLPFKIKKRMVDFLLRLHEGTLPRWLLDKLLDNSMRELDISRAKMMTDEVMHIASIFNSLRSLRLGHCSDDVLKEFVEKNSDLEELSLVATKQLTDKGLKYIATNCPKLRSFELTESDKISDKAIESILKQCEHLTTLTLKNCKKVKGSSLKVYIAEKGALRSKKPIPFKLVSLDMSGCPLSKGGLKKLSKVTNHLQSLKLHPVILLKGNQECLSILIRGCGTMKHLELAPESGYEIVEEVFSDLSSECRMLESLHIGSKMLTEQYVVDILTHCASLREISIAQDMDNGFAATSLPRTLRLCSTLEKISIKFGEPLYKPSTISDSALKAFLHSCGSLTHLALTEW